MAAPSTQPETAMTGKSRGLVVRASVIGAVFAAGFAALALGVLTEAKLDASGRVYLLVGVACGLLTGVLGNVIVARGALLPATDARAGAAFFRALIVDFALQFFAVAGLALLMFLAGVKFASLAAFGIALAGAAMTVRAPGTLLISRALTARAGQATRTTDDPATDDPATTVQDSNS